MTMTTPYAAVNFATADFPTSDIRNIGWRQAEAVVMNRLWNGEPAPDTRHAVARLLWSEASLYIRFDCRQKEPLFLNDDPQTIEKTMKLWEHDVCEVFLAPDASNPKRYAEFEIAPTGEWLDLLVDWTKEEPRDWEYLSEMESFALIEPEKVTMVMRIPWKAFGGKPKAGDTWFGNLFRQVGSGDTRGYVTWSPTMTDEPQFHVPEKFGEFAFRK